ncbi:1,2-phenylacetyl-CoA epoxidase subunit PaaC [Salsipaludibacter albus]|uniref:1,2-phenylacetyl-CoA epoxidase subunit PaaC n=1 Tax=Salsipaludibacter albus TaxID=2849650 RepID=UPI001EE41AED|nr:1,2-phenylacetyl-CoA epoxidase subunit PaaC [Salsipaludibacter albus]MBY5163257.1 phenylacetate-CoA oxygenase subunit PaaC [Salsipaludibacter albus]
MPDRTPDRQPPTQSSERIAAVDGRGEHTRRDGEVDATTARRELLLAIADDELVTGHRSSHWTGVAPSIEEDLAFSTIAQDEVNHADVWYQVLLTPDNGEVDRAEVDALGLGRPADGYRHAVLCERPPRDFAYTLARHWLYDHADTVRLATLVDSSDPDVAAVAAKLLHEERYHLEHADLWFRRLTGGGDEPRRRFRAGLELALPEAMWLFEPSVGADVARESGLLPESFATMFARWAEFVAASLDAVGLGDIAPGSLRTGSADGLFDRPGGRHGVHSDDFTADVWPEMTTLYRSHPGAQW